MNISKIFRLAVPLIVATASLARAAHPFICCDYAGNRVCVVSAEGKIEWEFACKNPQDCWRLPSGNYLVCYATGAAELTPDHKTVWQYTSPEKTEVHSCQPLPDGQVMVVECGPSRIVEVNREGKITKEVKLHPSPALSTHEQFRGARKTKEGHYLVCFKGDHKIVELDAEGRELRSIPVSGDPHEVIPLPEGHLLIDCGDGHKVVELDALEKVVWEITENDLPGNPLRLMAGCQRLPNGNTVLCNYLGHGHIGQQPQVVEVSPDKKVVWQIRDEANFKTINQIQLLDVPGDVTKGEIHR